LIETLNNVRKEIRQEALNTDAAFLSKKFMTERQAVNLIVALEQEFIN